MSSGSGCSSKGVPGAIPEQIVIGGESGKGEARNSSRNEREKLSREKRSRRKSDEF